MAWYSPVGHKIGLSELKTEDVFGLAVPTHVPWAFFNTFLVLFFISLLLIICRVWHYLLVKVKATKTIWNSHRKLQKWKTKYVIILNWLYFIIILRTTWHLTMKTDDTLMASYWASFFHAECHYLHQNLYIYCLILQ